MKPLTITEIRKQSDKELEKLLAERRSAVRQYRFDITGSKSKDVKAGANARKDIARLLTELAARKQR